MYNVDATVNELMLFTLCINTHTLHGVPYVHEQRHKECENVAMHTKDTHEATFTVTMQHHRHVFAAELIIISTLAVLQVKLTHVMTLSVKLVLCVVYVLDTSKSYLTVVIVTWKLSIIHNSIAKLVEGYLGRKFSSQQLNERIAALRCGHGGQ